MAQELNSITPGEAEEMGSYPYYIRSQTQKQVEVHCISIAFYAPPMVFAWQCDQTKLCEAEWEKAWWHYYAKHLLYPDGPKSCQGAMVEFMKAAIPRMCSHCHGNSVEGAYNNEVFEEEEWLLTQGITELVWWMGAL